MGFNSGFKVLICSRTSLFGGWGVEVVEVFHQNGTSPFYQLYLMRAKRKVFGKFPASQVPRFNAS